MCNTKLCTQYEVAVVLIQGESDPVCFCVYNFLFRNHISSCEKGKRRKKSLKLFHLVTISSSTFQSSLCRSVFGGYLLSWVGEPGGRVGCVSLPFRRVGRVSLPFLAQEAWGRFCFAHPFVSNTFRSRKVPLTHHFFVFSTFRQVFTVSKDLVPRVLSRVVEAVSEELSRLMQCVSSFSKNGALQVPRQSCASGHSF